MSSTGQKVVLTVTSTTDQGSVTRAIGPMPESEARQVRGNLFDRKLISSCEMLPVHSKRDWQTWRAGWEKED